MPIRTTTPEQLLETFRYYQDTPYAVCLSEHGSSCRIEGEVYRSDRGIVIETDLGDLLIRPSIQTIQVADSAQDLEALHRMTTPSST